MLEKIEDIFSQPSLIERSDMCSAGSHLSANLNIWKSGIGSANYSCILFCQLVNLRMRNSSIFSANSSSV
eukprot:3706731-Rhodomonas_salina.1